MIVCKDELGQCKFIVVIPDFSRLKTICPHPYYPIKGDVLSHTQDQIMIWNQQEVIYRFDSFCYDCRGKKPSNFFFFKKELFELQRDGILILLKKFK